ncbi:MAG: methylornithine synthase PylB [Thermoanaerobacterales bacterium]|nr:methylornithine synthase PylB [Thermoanaerobacterales bacterium]
MASTDMKLSQVLQKAECGEPLSSQELQFLLSLSEPHELNQVFKLARSLRNRYFENKVFLYSFVYFSTWCRNDCTFCYYRKSNKYPSRYRKTEFEVLDAAINAAESGVHLIDLTLGEDPYYYKRHGFGSLVDLVRKVKKNTGLPIMISPGVVPVQVLNELSVAGADWYACYQETHNRELFKQLRLDQNYDLRFSSKHKALHSGLLVEDGILTGVGETLSDIAVSIKSMSGLGAHQVRVMSFVPQRGTPMEQWQTPPRIRELLIIAVLRIVMPDRLIPASLDVDGIEGLQARLDAGANVITSLIPPKLGLAGVAQSTKDINEGFRTVQGVIPVLKQMGMRAASLEDYYSWIIEEKEKLKMLQSQEMRAL